jgi:hypothetical protein
MFSFYIVNAELNFLICIGDFIGIRVRNVITPHATRFVFVNVKFTYVISFWNSLLILVYSSKQQETQFANSR